MERGKTVRQVVKQGLREWKTEKVLGGHQWKSQLAAPVITCTFSTRSPWGVEWAMVTTSAPPTGRHKGSSPSSLSVGWEAWTLAVPRSWWICWYPWSFRRCICSLWIIAGWSLRCRLFLETHGRTDTLEQKIRTEISLLLFNNKLLACNLFLYFLFLMVYLNIYLKKQKNIC